jgi:hypothetical protein
MRHYIPDVILEDDIFAPCNLDPDCDTIGRLLYDYGEKFILSALKDGEYAIAVGNYFLMLDSLTMHFIEDEHWCWFDDYYSPDYTVRSIWDKLVPYIRSEALAGESLEDLEAGLAEIEASEAYQEYHVPSMIPFHDLKNTKTFLERFGNHSPVLRK